MNKFLLISQLTLLPQLLIAAMSWAGTTNTGVIVGGDCVRGNGIRKTVDRKAADFNMLETSGSFTIRIKSGAAQQIKITGDANILPLVTTTSQGNKMVLTTSKSICTEMGITLDISVANLEALVTNGSDTIKIQGIDTHKFALDMGGSSDVELAGRADALDASLSGAGDLNAKNLKTKETALNISGSNTATVYATDKLKVEILGVADVNYFGHPKKIEKQILGVGNLNAMD
ncbi:MAG: DUF2807 domain-containing protein [Desulfobulbaceae bacterium]|nr:DUF2807 domain-containing protein [Desulfobulbaceae bacterium]